MGHLIHLSFEKFNISAFKHRVARYHMTYISKVTVRIKKSLKEDLLFLERSMLPKIAKNRIFHDFLLSILKHVLTSGPYVFGSVQRML